MENDQFINNLRISCNGKIIYEGRCVDTRPCGNGVLFVKDGRIVGQWSPDGTCVGTFYNNDGTALPTNPYTRFI